MQGGVVELARQAAAAARAERGAAARARLPAVRRYRGVERLGDGVYSAEIMDAAGLRPVWLGSYATPEEAAHAYDAAARIIHGDRAQLNFPEPRTAPPESVVPVAAGGGGGGAPAAHARRLVGHARMRTARNGQQPVPVGSGGGGGAPAAHARALPRPLLGHARMRASRNGEQQPPPPPQAPAAPVDGGEQRQAAFPVQQAPAISQFLYHRAAARPAFSTVTGGSNGAGFYAAGPAIAAAAGGSNGGAGYGKGPMIDTEPEVPLNIYPASSELSSTNKESKALFDAMAAADPNNLIIVLDDSDCETVVDENITPVHSGASTPSSAAPPTVPPLMLKDLIGRSCSPHH